MNLSNHVRPVQLLAPGAALSTTTKSLVVDRYGYDTIAFWLLLGASGASLDGSNYWVPTVQESDTTADADFTTVAAADLLYAFTKVDATAKASRLQRAEYTGAKRYLRVVLTPTGTCSMPAAAVCLLGNPTTETLTAPDVGAAAT